MSLVHDAPSADWAGSDSPYALGFGRLASPPTPVAAGSDQLELLENAVTVALSALDYPTPSAWGDALTLALCSLAGADAGAILLPGTMIRWRAVGRDLATRPATSAWAVHDEATERLHRSSPTDLVLWARDDLADNGRPPMYSAGSGTVGVRIRATGGEIAAICVHRDRALGAAPQQLLAALRAIAPAFRAGVSAWQSSTSCSANVTRMLDSLADPALMFDVGGSVVHANPAVDRVTAAPETARLRDEAQRLAWALGAVARRRSTPRTTVARGADAASDTQATRRVQIGGSVYRLRGSIVGEQLLGAAPAVLVTITSTAAEPLTDDALRTDFGLTTREIQVARLLAEGLSNNEIADRIGVRFFTARNHVERTLSKLGVPSRHRVGPLLRHEVAERYAA